MHLLAATVRETCDVVVTNVLVLDPVLGVRKTSIGIREGRIAAIGRAGNPHTLSGVDVVVGTGTTIVSGEGLIATAGAIDTHVHLLSPRVMEASLSSGVTSIIGQEFGPVWGVGVNSPWALRTAFSAFDAWPVNIGFLARGSSSHPGPLVEALTEEAMRTRRFPGIGFRGEDARRRPWVRGWTGGPRTRGRSGAAARRPRRSAP